MAGCQTAPSPRPVAVVKEAGTAFVGWQSVALPGKALTDYVVSTDIHGEPVLRVRANASASMWRRRVHIEPAQLGLTRFAWRVPALMPEANLAKPVSADAVVRVVFAFDGDHARLPWRDRMLFDLAEGLMGERPPYATLMYVWDPLASLESVLPNARTDRIRKLVVENGSAHLGQWLRYERNLRADFERVFGEAPGTLIGVAVMTDSDNTESVAEAEYREVEVLGPRREKL